jgi:cytochrome c2
MLPIFGFLFAWAGGTTVAIGPLLRLPALLPQNYSLWMFAGYFHSGSGFMLLLLTMAALLTAGYAWLRFGIGLFACFPAGFGMQSLLSMATSCWALTTFKSNAAGPAAIGKLFVLVAVVWAIGWWLKRKRAACRTDVQPLRWHRPASAIAALGIVTMGAYGPYLIFRVSPFPVGEVMKSAAGVTAHPAPIVRVTAWDSTAFERDIAADTYKWCGFCHTYDKGGQPKAGPNLYSIFGQRAASVPNFHYSPALAQKREQGLIWSDEALDAFLANPDTFVPGTTMIVSSGPVTDPKIRRAVINMLKRDTMTGAIDKVPPPPGQ